MPTSSLPLVVVKEEGSDSSGSLEQYEPKCPPHGHLPQPIDLPHTTAQSPTQHSFDRGLRGYEDPAHPLSSHKDQHELLAQQGLLDLNQPLRQLVPEEFIPSDDDSDFQKPVKEFTVPPADIRQGLKFRSSFSESLQKIASSLFRSITYLELQPVLVLSG